MPLISKPIVKFGKLLAEKKKSLFMTLQKRDFLNYDYK
jgi:hypothetical protein